MTTYRSCSILAAVRRKPVYGAVVVFAVALVVRLAYLFRILQGSLRTPPDTSAYLEACQVLYTEPLAIAAQTKGLTYLGFTVPFCTVRAVGDGSGVAWAFIQVFLSVLTAVLVFYTAVRLENIVAGLVAGFSFALLFETLRYVVFMLSETVFITALILSLYALVRHRSERTWQSLLLVVVGFAWLVTSRPFGVLVIAGWLAFDLFPEDSGFRIGLIPRRVAIVGVIGFATLVQLVTNVARKAGTLDRGFRDGWIYYGGNWNSPLAVYEYVPRAASGTVGFLSGTSTTFSRSCSSGV